MNRIRTAISKMEATLANVESDAVARLEKVATLEFDEYCRFQNIKSATAGGKISFDEAQFVYSLLGESLETFKSQSLAARLVLIKVWAELETSLQSSTCQ